MQKIEALASCWWYSRGFAVDDLRERKAAARAVAPRVTSKAVGLALREFIPTVVQSVDAFMSDTDVEKGSRWAVDVAAELDAAAMGIICLTPDNLLAPWILFEAGALSKKIKSAETRVCTYLHSLDYASVTPPLAMFQHTLATEEGMNKLFDAMWPSLEESLKAAPLPEKGMTRDLGEMMAEVLVEVRQSAKDIQVIKLGTGYL